MQEVVGSNPTCSTTRQSAAGQRDGLQNHRNRVRFSGLVPWPLSRKVKMLACHARDNGIVTRRVATTQDFGSLQTDDCSGEYCARQPCGLALARLT